MQAIDTPGVRSQIHNSDLFMSIKSGSSFILPEKSFCIEISSGGCGG
jgi:hypothetical protein